MPAPRRTGIGLAGDPTDLQPYLQAGQPLPLDQPVATIRVALSVN